MRGTEYVCTGTFAACSETMADCAAAGEFSVACVVAAEDEPAACGSVLIERPEVCDNGRMDMRQEGVVSKEISGGYFL